MEIINPQDYKIGFTDQFFFDTNIWIILFGSIANFEEKNQRIYSKFFENLISRESSIFITSNVVSEFSNVLLRLDFNHWKSKSGLINPKFKNDYVGTESYKNVVEQIKSSLKKIFSLPNVIKVSDDFNSVNLDVILENFSLIDYNDSYIAQICSIKNYKLVTNDGDFKKINCDISIITTQ